MNNDTHNEKLRKLIRKIANLPKDEQKQSISQMKETEVRHNENEKSIGEIKKSLGNLQICIQYLLFDLEATRRERDQLQLIIDNQSPKDNDKAENGI